MTPTDSQSGHAANPPNRDGGFHMLLPVKTLANVKRRLESTLGALRADLTRAMLTDVLNAVGTSSWVADVLVVTADTEVAELAMAHGASVLREAGSQGLNRAVTSGFAALRQDGAMRTAIIPADIPLLTGVELDRVLQLMDRQRSAARRGVIGLCASRDGRGTNLMCLDHVSDYEFRYGRNSFQMHRETALAAGYRPVSLSSQLIALDIDTRADIDHYLAHCMRQPVYRGSHTWRFLQEHGFTATDDRVGQG
jgi:2-phospho-L-lactate guanylyltransferase